MISIQIEICSAADAYFSFKMGTYLRYKYSGIPFSALASLHELELMACLIYVDLRRKIQRQAEIGDHGIYHGHASRSDVQGSESESGAADGNEEGGHKTEGDERGGGGGVGDGGKKMSLGSQIASIASGTGRREQGGKRRGDEERGGEASLWETADEAEEVQFQLSADRL